MTGPEPGSGCCQRRPKVNWCIFNCCIH